MTTQLPKIAILDDYQGAALDLADWSVLNGRADITVFRDHLSDPAAVIARLQPFDAVCVMRERTPLPRAILTELPRLRLIVSTGARNASIDLDATRELGITVCNTGGGGNGTLELTWGLILTALRHLQAETTSVRAGGWQVAVGGDLVGKTLGIVGLGRIGSGVARVAQAFEMDVVAWSPNLTQEKAAAAGARLVSKAELFRTADIVTIHIVLSDRTRGLIGAEDLALMKPTSWLVNTSRGPLVHEAALVEALQERRLAGAALDVFATEPLPAGHPLRTLPNVVATGHIGFVTEASYRVFYQDTVQCLVNWLDGQRQ
ncbi:MAG: D-2-hydroxyacid dehydrogenase family protein [Caldilineaceae bacterium]